MVLGDASVLFDIRWTMASYAATGNTDELDRHNTLMVRSPDTIDARKNNGTQRRSRIIRDLKTLTHILQSIHCPTTERH